MTSITETNLRDKFVREKELDLPKVFEQIQENTYDRKNKKNTIPEALISHVEKENKEEPINERLYTGKYRTGPKKNQKNETADIAMNQIATLIKIVQTENQYAITAKRMVLSR